MCVAYCEIVQSALDACIPANGKVRLVSVNVKRAAVDASDAEPFIARFARRQRHRQIVLARLRPARAGIQNRVGRELIREIITVDDVHPLGKPCSKRMARRPH